MTFQGRTATPISLIQHRHITYVNPSKNKANDAEIDAIEEETTTTLHSKRRYIRYLICVYYNDKYNKCL